MKIAVQQGWVPTNLIMEDERPVIELALFESRRPQLPFIGADLENCGQRVRIPLSEIADSVPDDASLTPLIFHMSRCGSTLLCNMLRNIDRFKVVAEPEPINQVFQVAWPSKQQQVVALRALESLYRYSLCESHQTLIIKSSAWTSAFSEIILQALPHSPWCFLYRDPVEVLSSNHKTPPQWLWPATLTAYLDLLGNSGQQVDKMDLRTRLYFDNGYHPGMPPIELCSKVLSECCRSIKRSMQGSRRGCIVDYAELPDALFSTLNEHFKLELTGLERVKAQSATMWNSKTFKLRKFKPDGERKRASASDDIINLAESFLQREIDDLKHLAGH